MNNAEKFKQIFGLYATELWSMPESDFLEWLNRDVETTQIDHIAESGRKVADDDCISRQTALDAFGLSEKTRKYGGDHSGYDTRMLYEIQDTLENLPAVHPDHVADISKKVEGDCISRQAAIDIERNATVDTNPSHFEAHQKFTQFMDDVEVSSFGRWQWSNGFNTALTAVGIDLKKLPSVQPEIIRCKDCKHRDKYGCCKYWKGLAMGDIPIATDDYDFCSYAKRI